MATDKIFLNKMKTVRKQVEYREFYGATAEKKAGRLVAVESRNCDFRGGRLGCGIGAKKYYLEYNADAEIARLPVETYGTAERFFAHTYLADGVKTDTVAVNTSNGRLFIFDNTANALRAIDSSAELVKGLTVYDENGDAFMLVCGKKNVYLYAFASGATMLFRNVSISGACVFRERVFLGGEFTVRYSAPMNTGDFSESIDEGGKVELPSMLGEIVGLETFGGAVYVFRRFGITKLTGGGAGREFAFEDLPYASAGIVGSSIVVCGEEIRFLSAEGICAFNGNGTRVVKNGLTRLPMRSTHTCYGAFAFGRYYLSYIDKDGVRRNVVLDLEDEKNVGESFFAQGLSGSCGRAICSIDGEISELDMQADLPSGETYWFDAGETDFGELGEKVLRRISLVGRGRCLLSVAGRNGAKELVFDMGESGERGVDVVLKGKAFSISLRLEKGCEIRAFKAVFDRIEGVGV